MPSARVFVIDTGGKVSTIGRTSNDAIDSLPRQDWRSLGRIPGPADADLQFQVTTCREKIVDNASDVRLGITTGVSLGVGNALAGTAIEKAIDDADAISQCTPHGETMGLWLDHQPWRPSLLAADIVPSEKTFGILIPTLTLNHIFDVIWNALPKRLNTDGDPDPNGDLELKSYEVRLVEPNTLTITLRGEVHSAPFAATATGVFGVRDGHPNCDVSVSLDAGEAGIAGVISVLLGPFAAPLGSKLEDLLGTARQKIGQKVQPICTISDAFISELFLPKPKDASKPRQALEVVYDGVKLSPTQGMLGFRLTPPVPRIQNPWLNLIAVLIPQGAGRSSTAVSYHVETHDLKPPLSATWTVTNIEPLKMSSYVSGKFPVAIVTYPIQSTPPPVALGRINVMVTDSEGLRIYASQDVTLTADGISAVTPSSSRAESEVHH